MINILSLIVTIIGVRDLYDHLMSRRSFIVHIMSAPHKLRILELKEHYADLIHVHGTQPRSWVML